jgi:hypothetical protein
MSFIGGDAETYMWDRKLFAELGLEPFRTDNNKKLKVGRVPGAAPGSYVDIWVSCYPAMFWEFRGMSEEGQRFRFKSGSGSLVEYWPAVKLFLTGMLTKA